MSDFALVPGDMRAASGAVEDAAARARTADGAGPLALLAGALPGTTTARVVPDLARAWTAGVRDWSDRVDRLSAQIDRLRADAGAVDSSVAARLVGGPR